MRAVNRAEDEEVRKTIVLFKEFGSRMATLVQAAWIEGTELTMGQIRTMMLLHMKGSASVGSLAESLAISEPTASQLVDRLVRAGLVDRSEDPADRRRTLLTLSSAGRTRVEERAQLREEWTRTLLERVSSGDLTALRQGLHALIEAMDSLGGDWAMEAKHV